MSATLPQPLTDDALRKQAASQVDAEIKSQVDPLQTQIAAAGRNQEGALTQVGKTFADIQPTVTDSAGRVADSYAAAEANQKSIFDQAQSQLSQLQQGRASEAQRMAQELGAPVAVGDFTRPFDNAQTDLTYLGAGQQLHTLAYAQAGTQQAETFAGQVFPVMRTEAETQVRRQFAEEIKTLQDQLTAVKSQRGAQVNARYSEMRQNELQYRIQVVQQQQARLDSQRNYNLQVKNAKSARIDANRQYHLDNQQLQLDVKKRLDALAQTHYDEKLADKTFALELKKYGLTKSDFDLRQGIALGTIGGKPTLETTKTTADIASQKRQDALTAKSLGISAQELQLKKDQLRIQTGLANKKLKVERRGDIYELIEAALNPKPGGTITRTVKVAAPAPSFGQAIPKDYIQVPVSQEFPTGYARLRDVKEPAHVTEPITDPTALVNYLTATGFATQAEAVQAVKARMQPLGLPTTWKFGEKWPKKAKSTTTKPKTTAKPSKYQTYTPPVAPKPPGSGGTAGPE